MATFWIVEDVKLPKHQDESESQNDYTRMSIGEEYECQMGAHKFTLTPQRGGSIKVQSDARKAIFIRNRPKAERLRAPGAEAVISLRQHPATLDLMKRHKSPGQPRQILSTLSLFCDPFPAEAGRNYLFYTGREVCHPYRMTISEIHDEWRGDYATLEREHGYIQWLFPLFVRSSYNSESPAMTRGEAVLLRRSRLAATNLVESYRIMLDFYGLRLVDADTGEVGYAEDKRFVGERMANLAAHGHNFLRITRILTSLGHLGFARYKRPLLEMLERVVRDYVPRARDSLEGFWKETVLYDSEGYYQSTKELPIDREPSVFFTEIRSSQSPVSKESLPSGCNSSTLLEVQTK